MADNTLISLSKLIKTYTLAGINHQVLKAVSLSVSKGELLAIMGSSGSGKSTLMNIIGLLDKADSGEYHLQAQNIADLNADETARLRNRQMGFVFQQFHLLPRFSAFQNVELPLHYRDLNAAARKEKVLAALDRVGMLKYAERTPMQLSGGQQQRIAIARALVGDPSVLLADEPTGALDSRTGAQIMNLFLALHQEGRTVIIITHDETIANQCLRKIILADGEIVAEAK